MSAPEPNPSSTAIKIGLAASVVLAIVAAGTFYWASQRTSDRPAADGHAVTILASECEPMSLEVPAGKRSFAITNNSDRPVEWEILDGVMVVAERENILPGMTQDVSARLDAGDYEITCGLLSNPRGTLHVTATAESQAADAQLETREFLGALSEYRVYLTLGANAAIKSATALADAIQSGDLATARNAYAVARLDYLKIEPMAYRFSDLQSAIDADAAYLENRENDAAFTGFHRIEYALFDQNDLTDLGPVADKLVADLEALKSRMSKLKMTPEVMATTAESMTDRVLQGRLGQPTSDYDQTNIADLEASLAGIAKPVDELATVIEKAKPEISASLEDELSSVHNTLQTLKTDGASPTLSNLSAAERDKLNDAFTRLSDAIAQIMPVIGES